MFMQARAEAFEAVCLYIFLTSVTYTISHMPTHLVKIHIFGKLLTPTSLQEALTVTSNL